MFQFYCHTTKCTCAHEDMAFIQIPNDSFQYTASTMHYQCLSPDPIARTLLERSWSGEKKTLAPFYETPYTLGHHLWSLLPIQKCLDAQNMAVRKGQFSTPAKLTTALTAPSQSLASLDASSLGHIARCKFVDSWVRQATSLDACSWTRVHQATSLDARSWTLGSARPHRQMHVRGLLDPLPTQKS